MPTSPQHLDRIVCKHRIMTDECCLFSVGLGDQQPVKGVLVMRWQALQGEDMTESDRQHLEVVSLLLTGNHLCQRETQVELAQLQLDLHLPGTGHAEEQKIRPSLTCRTGLRRELLRSTIPPDEGVRIQQHLHGVPVQNSSGNGSSKSSLVQIAPGCKPATRGVAPVMGTIRASGVLPSVRIISVPAVTNDSSSTKWVWASCTSTVLVCMGCPTHQ